MRLTFTTEQKVLLKILKGNSPSHLEGVDTDALFSLFKRHRLFPIASEIIEKLDQKNRDKWKSTIQALTLKSLHQASVLGTVIKGFRDEGIEAIPLKGPVLAQSLYGDLGSRHFVDLDILVGAANIEHILKIADGLGLLLKFPEAGFSIRQWNYYFRYKKDIGMASQDQSVFIELHNGIDNHAVLNNKEGSSLWDKLVSVKIGSTEFRCMNHESTFLYLVFHGGLHLYTRLFWLRDVAEALNRWGMDHTMILQEAEKLGMERLLGVSLELASELFSAEIPHEYEAFLERDSRAIQRLRRLSLDRIFSSENLSFKAKINRQYYIFSVKPGISYKWALISRLVHRWYIGRFMGGK